MEQLSRITLHSTCFPETVCSMTDGIRRIFILQRCISHEYTKSVIEGAHDINLYHGKDIDENER
jgi:hypothetical protein